MKYNGTTVATAVFWAAVAFCIHLTISNWGSWGTILLIWFLAPLGALVLAFVAGMIAGVLGAQPIDEPEDIPTPPKPVEAKTVNVSIEVVKKSEIIGEYMGESIYDWMILRSPTGNEMTLTFVRIVPGAATPEDLADDGFVHGRLLYRVKK